VSTRAIKVLHTAAPLVEEMRHREQVRDIQKKEVCSTPSFKEVALQIDGVDLSKLGIGDASLYTDASIMP
jgi:hypothetical protein